MLQTGQPHCSNHAKHCAPQASNDWPWDCGKDSPEFPQNAHHHHEDGPALHDMAAADTRHTQHSNVLTVGSCAIAGACKKKIWKRVWHHWRAKMVIESGTGPGQSSVARTQTIEGL